MALLRRLLGSPRRSNAEPNRFPGRLDEIRGGFALGWATDRQEPGSVVTVALQIDGQTVAEAQADQPRPDVQAAGFGQGLGGFRLRIPDAFADGAEHRVGVVAGSGESPLPGSPLPYRADAPPPEPAAEEAKPIQGYFEGMSQGAAIGWAYDPNAPETRLELELIVDGAPAGRFVADIARADVAKAGHGDGFHGFLVRFPGEFCDSQPHAVEVALAGTDIRLPGGPHTVLQSRAGMAYLDRPAACISGWATPGVDVEIRYDGGPPTRVKGTRFVSGFGDEKMPTAHCGFSSPIPPECLDGGWHAASVRFVGSTEELSGSPFEFRLRTPAVQLGLTRSSGRLVQGWASDVLAPDRPVRLAVFADGVALGNVRADGVRADIPGRPTRNFAFTLPRGAQRLDFALAETPHAPFASFSIGGGDARPIAADDAAVQDEARLADPAFVEAARAAFAAFLAAPGARFDAAWYRLTYPEAIEAAAPGNDPDAAAFAHYRDHGHAAGHAPSPLFDEAWYRHRWASVDRAVAAGRIPCGYAHYLAVGAQAGFAPVPGLDADTTVAESATAPRSGATADPLDAFLSRGGRPAAPPPRSLYDDWVARLLKQAPEGTAAALAASDRAIRARLDAPLPATPLVSVIMPTFNRAHTIAEAIGSLVEQSYQNWELLVCDDGSIDRTAQVVAQMGDPRIRYFAFEKANGAIARNRGLALARGEYIAYLDSDNLWHPSYLDVMMRTLLAAPGRPCAYGAYLDTEIVGTRVEFQALAVEPFDPVKLSRANFIDLNTICHHRHLYDWLGGFDETLPRVQDWDLALRYFSIFRPIHVPQVLAFYRRNVAWGQVTAISLAQDVNAVVSRKTNARLADGHLRLDIDWPADPRLTVILRPGPEAALMAELLIHAVADGAEVTLAHPGRGPAARTLHPDDPVADLPLGPDAFAAPERLAAALEPFLPREGAVLALGLSADEIAALSGRLGRPVDALAVDANGLCLAAADLDPNSGRSFHLGVLPLPIAAEQAPFEGRRPLLLLGGERNPSVVSTPMGGLIVAPDDLLSGPWQRIRREEAAEPWSERGLAALDRALSIAGSLTSRVPAEALGPLGLCLVVEALRRGIAVTLPSSGFADPLIAARVAADLSPVPGEAARLVSATGRARAYALSFHPELTVERLRFYLYRRCFEGNR